MATLNEVSQQHYAQREQLARAAAAVGASLWSRVDEDDLSGSWQEHVARLVTVLSGAQLSAARAADSYTTRVLEAQGVDVAPAGEVNPDALSGVASDGRELESLLWSPVVATKTAIARGATVPRAMATGSATLDMMLRTQVADAGRAADGVAITSRPKTGYVRMLKGKSCSRCVILAGRFYRYNNGFRRHPRCDCIHVPAKGEKAAQAEGLVSDPREYFDSLSRAEQDRIFTQAGAQAIRDGADMSQVVNARRRAAGLSQPGRLTREEQRMLRDGRSRGRLQRVDVYGRQVFTTTEGTTRRGLAGSRLGAWEDSVRGRGERYRRARAPRLMPESIYELAESREDAIRLLHRFGYII